LRSCPPQNRKILLQPVARANRAVSFEAASKAPAAKTSLITPFYSTHYAKAAVHLRSTFSSPSVHCSFSLLPSECALSKPVCWRNSRPSDSIGSGGRDGKSNRNALAKQPLLKPSVSPKTKPHWHDDFRFPLSVDQSSASADRSSRFSAQFT